MDWALACKPKGHQFDSQSGHMPVLQAWSPVEGAQEATTHWCFFPSLSPSLPLSLKINKIFKRKTSFSMWGLTCICKKYTLKFLNQSSSHYPGISLKLQPCLIFLCICPIACRSRHLEFSRLITDLKPQWEKTSFIKQADGPDFIFLPSQLYLVVWSIIKWILLQIYDWIK